LQRLVGVGRGTLMEMRNGGPSMVDVEGKSGFGGGVEDVYGEDRATEDQLVTPWTVSVAR
jgi:malate dehydrogenase (oxaloacetate-decarboxylating)(NADP+)